MRRSDLGFPKVQTSLNSVRDSNNTFDEFKIRITQCGSRVMQTKTKEDCHNLSRIDLLQMRP